jgi:hypothetical protein
MTTFKRFSLALVLTLFGLVLTAHAQTPSIEVSTDSDNVEFAAQGVTRKVHVEVFSPSGELVFETSDSDGQSIRWGMVNQKGERVSDGVYLATVTVVDSLGKKRKRVEQITVSSPQYAAQAAAAAPQESLAPTGAGAAGKIAKWTTSSNLGNSSITEGAGGKIGVNVSPVATLQVNGLQPAALANNGVNAPVLLQTSGGKGGNTTGADKKGGLGASLSLLAGAGGDAPSGGINGTGGNITLQPGSAGTGGTGGAAGDVLIATTEGRVAIGANPLYERKLTVRSKSAGSVVYIENINTAANSRGLDVTAYNSISIYGFSTNNTAVHGKSKAGTGVFGESETGPGVEGKAVNSAAVSGQATGSGTGVQGTGGTGKGVYGQSTSNSGVFGFSGTGDGVTGQSASGYAGRFYGKTKFSNNLEIGGSEFYGATPRQMINLYNTSYGIGIQTSTLYFRVANTGGYNWYMGGVHNNTQNAPGAGGTSLMRLDSSGNLFTKGAVNPVSDRNAKSNFSTVDPRFILEKLAAIPIRTWSYKADSEAVRHIGPVAQDFRAAFELGADDKHISTVDADGVALASIQALYQLMLEKDRQIEALTRKVEQQQARLNQVRHAVRKRAAKR